MRGDSFEPVPTRLANKKGTRLTVRPLFHCSDLSRLAQLTVLTAAPVVPRVVHDIAVFLFLARDA